MLRTHIKNVLKAIESKDKQAAQQAYRKATSVIDRMAGKGLLHKNAAAHHKSQLNSHLRILA